MILPNKKQTILLSLAVLLSGCFSNYTPIPKPKAYYQIPLPKKAYKKSSFKDCPFQFELPIYSEVQQKEAYFGNQVNDPCWFNLYFPKFNATLYFSYKEINGKKQVEEILNDTRKLTWHHTVKAEYIDERDILKENNVHGIYYNIGGNAASSVQFYLTDSLNHFVRASLYFRNTPNIDSTREVLNFIEQDVQYLIETFEWK